MLSAAKNKSIRNGFNVFLFGFSVVAVTFSYGVDFARNEALSFVKTKTLYCAVLSEIFDVLCGRHCLGDGLNRTILAEVTAGNNTRITCIFLAVL